MQAPLSVELSKGNGNLVKKPLNPINKTEENN